MFMKKRLTPIQQILVGIGIYLLSSIISYPINAVFEVVGAIAFLSGSITLIVNFFKKKNNKKLLN